MQTLNLRLTRDNLSRPWGFRLQGGSETGYPLSVQRVFSGSPAEGILQRNDEIKFIDNCNMENVTSKEVQDLIRTSGSQINFLVVRDSNKFKTYGNEENEEKVTVQAARLKFLNNENCAPRPFGTQYQKKSNTLPSNLSMKTTHEYINKTDLIHSNQEMDDDDIADYNFMTLPVSERKKLFAVPTEKSSLTMPRQRSNSYRHFQKSYQTLPRPHSSIYETKAHEFGWGPSQEKIDKARNVRPTTSAVPLQYQGSLASPRMTKSYTEKVTSTYQPGYQSTPRSNRLYSSNKMINSPGRQFITSSTLNCSSDSYQNEYPSDKVKSETKYIYYGGQNTNKRSTEPSIMIIPSNRQTQNLYVNTNVGGNQMISPSHSPRYFRPAYPAYNVDTSAMDNMSIISVRSEPYSKCVDRSLGYDRAGAYRINRDSSSSHREVPPMMDRLHIGEPRTRVIANPASPSCHLNWSFWGREQPTERKYEQPQQNYNIEYRPTFTDSKTFRRAPNVPKSQSTIIMNPTRTYNDSNYTETAWLSRHRDSYTGASDF